MLFLNFYFLKKRNVFKVFFLFISKYIKEKFQNSEFNYFLFFSYFKPIFLIAIIKKNNEELEERV